MSSTPSSGCCAARLPRGQCAPFDRHRSGDHKWRPAPVASCHRHPCSRAVSISFCGHRLDRCQAPPPPAPTRRPRSTLPEYPAGRRQLPRSLRRRRYRPDAPGCGFRAPPSAGRASRLASWRTRRSLSTPSQSPFPWRACNSRRRRRYGALLACRRPRRLRRRNGVHSLAISASSIRSLASVRGSSGFGVLQPVLLLFRLAHALGARAAIRPTGRGPCHCRAPRQPFSWLRTETPFEKQTDGILEHRSRPGRAGGACGNRAPVAIKKVAPGCAAPHKKAWEEHPEQGDDEKIERHSRRAKGGSDQQQITVVQAGAQCGRHGQAGQDQQPRTNPSPFFSFVWRRLRNAARLVQVRQFSDVDFACRHLAQVVWAASTALSLVSKCLPSHSWATFNSLR